MADHTNYVGAWPHDMGIPTDEGPIAYAMGNFLFPVANSPQRFNLRDEHILNKLDMVQSVFIDNQSSTQITLGVDMATGMRIISKAMSQGWYPLPMKMDYGLYIQAGAVIADPTLVRIIFANQLIVAGPWLTQ